MGKPTICIGQNFKLLACCCSCTGQFVSDLFGNHVGFPTRRLSLLTDFLSYIELISYGHMEAGPCITKTCPCNVYPPEPHFYIVKLWYAGIYLIQDLASRKHVRVMYTSWTPLLYSKTGVCRNILNFASKQRLWVLVRTASLRWF